jgi:hypothetical protein
MAAIMWKNSSKNVEFDNIKILYETLLDFIFTVKWYFLNKPCNLFLLVYISVCVHTQAPILQHYVMQLNMYADKQRYFGYTYVINKHGNIN